MQGYVLAVGLIAGVVLVLGLVALMRCHREDIPAVIEAFGRWWWRRWS